MADKRISQLVDRGTVVNNDVVPIVVNGAETTNKATISSIQTFMQGNLDLGVTSVGITLGTTGTDVNVSGSPVTSSGNITINLPTASDTNRGALSSADWSTFNSKQPAGNYVTIDTTQTITDQKTFTTSGSSDTMIISHGSGSGFALDVIKAGNNEAIRVNKTSGSGNAMTVIGGNFEAPTIVKTGGTSSQFLKADGSVDSTVYYPNSNPSGFTSNVGTVTSVAATEGTGISISGSPITTSGTLTITNTAPDQTVSITAGSGISVSGTYPSFTVASTITQYTDALARAAISLTVSGASGASTYNSTTGVLNVPTYTLTGLGGVPTTRSITINGTAQDLSADRTFSVGTVTSVAALTLSTTGTDVTSSVANGTTTPVITLNIPTASAANRGALSSADWTTFNNKTSNTGTVTSVGLSSATSGVTIGSTPITTSGTITLAIATASGSQNGLLSSTDWTTFNNKQNALTNPVTGTGTTNYIPKFTSSSAIGNSQIFDDGTNVGIGTTSLGAKLDIEGGSGSISVRIKGDQPATSYYYGYMYDGTNLKGTTQTNIFYAGGSIAANTTVAEYAGLRIDPPTVTATGAVVTNNYGIYQSDGVQKNYFAGNVGIGTTSPANKLDVYGNIGVNTSGQIRTISTYYGANSEGLNIFIGGGGTSSVGAVGETYKGAYNTSVGVNALFSNTTGYYNSAMGAIALYSNTTGFHNSAMGMQVLFSNTTGYSNSAMGRAALYFNTTGYSNSAMGFDALSYNTTGYKNTGLGYGAGYSPSDNIANKRITTDYDMTLIGYGATKNSASQLENSIAIGVGTLVTSSNTAMWGNASMTSHIFQAGNVLIGTTTDNGSKLRINGSIALPHVTKSANYTLDGTDYTVGFDCASNRTANLPDATTCAGRVYVIYQYNTGSGTRSVTLDGNGSQTINGVTTYSLSPFCDFTSVTISSDGSNWVIISSNLTADCL